MLDRLGLEYIDLVYFHQSIGDYVGGWKEMEKALEMGKVRAIGISNFDVNDSIWNSLVETARIKPQIVQIECHPYAQRKHWQEMAKKQTSRLSAGSRWVVVTQRVRYYAILLLMRLPRHITRLLHRLLYVGIFKRDSPSFPDPAILPI